MSAAMHAHFFTDRPAGNAAAPLSAREVRKNANHWIRRTHRWVAMTFTLLVIANVAAYGLGAPPLWLVYAPLPPLLLLMLGGLYMFFQPLTARRRAPARETQA